MGLRSGDWLGHSRTLKCFLRSHSFVARAVCLGSLSCWKTQPRFIFNALADGRRFSLKISRYMAPFILSFTQISRPGPFAEKQPQSMMCPPPCFTVGMVFFGCNSAFFLLQTQQVEFLPKSYILVSSDILPILFWIIQMLSSKLQMGLDMYWLKQGDTAGGCSEVLVIILTPRGEILRGAPDRGRLSVVLYVFHFLIIAPKAAYLLQIQSSQPGAGLQFCFWCPLTALWSWP